MQNNKKIVQRCMLHVNKALRPVQGDGHERN